MTYAAAVATLKAPRFGDSDAIAARDLVAAVDRVAELLAANEGCEMCGGTGDARSGAKPDVWCWHCGGQGAELDDDTAEQAADLLASLPPDARQEALRRARTQRKEQGGSQGPAGEAGAL